MTGKIYPRLRSFVSILLIAILSVQSYAAPTETAFLSVDIDGESGTTKSGWSGWDLSDGDVTDGVPIVNTFGSVTVTLTPEGDAGHASGGGDAYDRGSGAIEPLDDAIYAVRDTGIGFGQNLFILEFSGLNPSANYEITLLSYDPWSGDSDGYTAVDTTDPYPSDPGGNYQPAAGGVNNPSYGSLLARYAHTGPWVWTEETMYNYSASFFVEADVSGVITLYVWADPESYSTQTVTLLNGFQLGLSSYTWDSETDNDFATATNWLDDVAPGTSINSGLAFSSDDTGDRIITGVDSAYTNILGINFAAAGGNYTISGSGSLSIVSGNTIGSGSGSNTHTISVNIISNGAGGIIFNGTDNITISSVISGDGGITKSGTSTLLLSGNNTYTGDTTLSAGTLTVDGQIVSPVTVNGGSLMGTGTIDNNVTINNGGTMAPGNSIGTTVITGDYVQESGSTYEAEVLRSGGTLTSDLLDVTGTATLESGSYINPIDLSGPGVINQGDEFTIISADGGTTDNGATLVDYSVLLTFSGAVVGNDYVLTATTAKDVYTQNNAHLFTAINSDYSSATGDYATVIGVLDGLNTAGINAAAERLSPLPHASTTFMNTRLVQDLAFDLSGYLEARRHNKLHMTQFNTLRQSDLLLADASDNPEMLAHAIEETAKRRRKYELDQKVNTFIRPFGVFYSQDSTTEFVGYNAEAIGAQFGMDWLWRDWILGFGGAYSHSRLNYDKSIGDADIDSLRFGPYASYFYDRFYVDGSFSIGYHMNNTRRDVQFGGIDRTADGHYDAYDFSANVTAGYKFLFGQWTLIPNVSVDYTRYRHEAFAETDASDAGLDVEARTQQSLLSRIGIKLHTITNLYDLKLAPELYVGYAHEFMNEKSLTSNLIGGTTKFSTDVDISRDDSFYYGAGLSGLLRKNISAFVRYEGEIYSSAKSNYLKAGLTIKF